MKKWFLFTLILSLILVPIQAIGDETDPVISSSYLDEVFQEALLDAISTQLSQGQSDAFATLAQQIALANLERLDGEAQKAQGTLLLKQGDVLTLEPGTKITVTNGSITPSTTQLVNISDGVLAPNSPLSLQKAYMMGDDVGQLTVGSTTCQLMVTGVYSVDYASGVDYGSRALALQTMGLFLGTDNGFDLENSATRGQGLVMFLRVLGLEDEALDYTGTCPFTDVATSSWLYPYVSYAYDMGYTNGVTATTFAPDTAITAQAYTTFLLRALHFDEGSDFTYETALTQASTLNVFSNSEISACSQGTFYRYHMVYLSYESLFAVEQTAKTMLMAQLVDQNAMTSSQLYQGICQVLGQGH